MLTTTDSRFKNEVYTDVCAFFSRIAIRFHRRSLAIELSMSRVVSKADPPSDIGKSGRCSGRRMVSLRVRSSRSVDFL